MFKQTALLLVTVLCLPTLALGEDEEGRRSSEKLTAGPADKLEKVKPGPIDDDADGKFFETLSGLKYRILRQGSRKLPKAENSVEVHYKGWLDDKTIFDSSYRRGSRVSFPLRRVIPGWTEGMQLIGVGGMIELEIPSRLGYGPRPTGKIPPNSTLHFIVELFDIQ